ncbi:hypothetical protein [Anaerotignum sp.]|uniref:hypothetical protein n=1 Tax=Anaerotignum sp. TaxID=2039241 RepID=UPI0028A5ACB1|nr:hypothetical protein [Anaerotignum sp.]
MSIFSKINRIVALRNGIRNRLVTFGLANASTKLEGCKTALEGMTDNTKKTTTSSPIMGTFSSGATEQIFGKTGEGYCSANSLIRIPVANLKPENIKNGVNIGGVVGNVLPLNKGVLTYDVYNAASNYAPTIVDGCGNRITDGTGGSGSIRGTGNYVGNAIFVMNTMYAKYCSLSGPVIRVNTVLTDSWAFVVYGSGAISITIYK